MLYHSVTFSVSGVSGPLLEACRELLADALGSVGYESFEDTAAGLVAYVQSDAYLPAAVDKVLAEFPVSEAAITYTAAAVPDRDWNAAWEAAGFEPIVVAGRLTVYDADHTADTSAFSTPVNIGITARNAFGTATHATTQMMLAALLDTPLEGRRVLDCGCGTGILAIAALRCGARAAVAYDIDEWSVSSASNNALQAAVGDKLEVLHGDSHVLTHIDGLFDVVMANINRNILLADMAAFRSVMAKGATLLLSGFYTTDIPQLQTAAEALGLTLQSTAQSGEWAAIRLIFNAE